MLSTMPLVALIVLGTPSPETELAATESSATARTRHSVEVSYFAHNFTHPGIMLGYTFRAATDRNDRHALTLGLDLGAYYWARHDIGVIAAPRIGWRGRARFGLTASADFNLGYLHTLAAGNVYGVEGGNIKKLPSSSTPFLWFGGTLGVGWTFRDVGDRVDLTPLVRVGAYGQYPMWDEVVLRFVTTLGMEIRI